MAIYQGIDSGETNLRKITIKSSWGGLPTLTKGKPGKKILVLPSNMLTFRQFDFPFQDRRRIQEILPGELMESMVLPLEKLYWDITSIHKNNARVMVAIKEDLDRFIESQGNSVQVVDAEPCALVRTAAYSNFDDALIIDFGATKTMFCGIKEGKLDMFRVRMTGGNHIDRILSEEKNISLEEAEQIKITEGVHHKSIYRFLNSLFNSSSIFPPIDYEKVVLTGGGAQMPGLADYIHEKLEKPAEYFKLPGDLSPFYDAVAFGAALYETGKQEKVNFKKDKREGGGLAIFWLFLFLIPLLIFSVSLKMKENQITKENRLIKREMVRAVKKEFPNLKSVTSPLRQTRAMVKREKSGNGKSSKKVISILNEISITPKGPDISFYEIDIDLNHVRLKGEADSFQSVDNFRSELEKKFEKAEIPVQKKKGDDRITFVVKLSTEEKGPVRSRRKEK